MFLVFLISSYAIAQEVERVQINGRILVDSDEKEGIVVYNQSAKIGVTTDENGSFKIDVALNDVLAFSALQFQNFTIKIDTRIIESRQVSVRLVEDINKLNEVIVLPYDLSGNIAVDVAAVRTYNVDMSEIFKGEEDLDDYKLSADRQTAVENPLLNENRFINGVDFVAIYGLFFKKKNKSESKVAQIYESRSPIIKRYDPQFLRDNFDIPLDLTEGFILYVEAKKYPKSLLENKNELLFFDFLREQSALFLNSRK
jgi:hypothetical protein